MLMHGLRCTGNWYTIGLGQLYPLGAWESSECWTTDSRMPVMLHIQSRNADNLHRDDGTSRFLAIVIAESEVSE